MGVKNTTNLVLLRVSRVFLIMIFRMFQTIKENIKKALGMGVYKIDLVHHQSIKTLYSQFVKPNDLVFDIGANVGNRIVPLLEIGAKVIALEPQPKCIQILNVRFGANITIEPKGVDAKVGTKAMHISDNTVLSTFSEEWIEKTKEDRFKGTAWDKSETITMTTFDALIEKYGKPKFAKIDVEGYEKNVLSGLTQSIDYISFEYAVPEQSASLKECLDLLFAINPSATCNYSIGETMQLALQQWITVSQMKQIIDSPEFVVTLFGDIYVCNIG